jgi:ribonuclease HI
MMLSAIVNDLLLPLIVITLSNCCQPSEALLAISAQQPTPFIVVTLQFDGSFRPPKDPGRATLPRRLAVAAACVSVEAATDSTLFLPFAAVGTRVLAVPTDMTSQQAEYEGLLLGLRYLYDHWPDLMCKMTNNSSHDKRDVGVTLKIQGDCKTVIDQISGKAVPRKLQSHWNEAKSVLNQIVSREESLMLDVCLIPRRENGVCDNLCTNLMNIMTSKVWNDCISNLESVNREAVETRMRPTSGAVNTILTLYLNAASSVIRYSLRACLYAKLAILAEQCNDHKGMIQVGERLWEEANLIEPNTIQSFPLKVLGVKSQINGWRGIGDHKKATFLERKHRVLFRAHSETESLRPSNDYEFLRSLGHAKEEWNGNVPLRWIEVLNKWFCESSATSDMDTPIVWVDNQ